MTALFVDIVGSTHLLAGLDPEDARGVLDEIIAMLTGAVTRSGGTVAKTLGDGLFALFGAPLAQESHAFRACFAAEEMQRLTSAMPLIGGRAVTLRIGLHSGIAVIVQWGEGPSARLDAVGDVINQAAHLEARAPPASILMSSTTHRLAGTAVEVRRHASAAATPGAIETLELVRCVNWRNVIAVPPDDAPSSFVGREREAAYLHDAISRLQEGRGDIIVLEGEAGSGKTRCLAEVLAGYTSDQVQKIGVAGVVTRRTAPDAVLRQIVLALLGLASDATENEIAERLTAGFPELAGTAAPLAWLVATEAQEGGREEAEALRHRALAAVKALVLTTARQRPIVLVVDDYQWVDDSTRSFLRMLGNLVETAPLLVLVAARGDEAGGASDLAARHVLRLSPLSKTETRQLLVSAIGARAAETQLGSEIAARSQDNPRFLLEIVRSMVEEGLLFGEPGDMQVSGELTPGAIPESLADLFEERSDRLERAERQLLQVLSAFEDQVTVATAAALVGEGKERTAIRLQTLSDAGLAREVAFLPEASFVVASPLIAAAACRSLLKKERRRLHGRICDYLLGTPDAPQKFRAVSRQAFLGGRFDLAAEAGYLAGRNAYGRLAYGESAELLRTALQANDQRPGEDETKRTLAIDIRLALREALFPQSAFDEIGRLLEEAMAIAEALGDRDRQRAVRRHLVSHLIAIGRLDQALPLARALVSEKRDMRKAADASYLLVQILASQGHYREAERIASRLLQLLESAEGADAMVSRALGRMWTIWCASEQGRFEHVMNLVMDSQSDLASDRPPFFRILAGIGSGLFWLRYGETRLAADTLAKVLPLTELEAARPWYPAVASPLGLAFVRLGRAEEALPLLQGAVDRTPYRGGVGQSLRMTHLAECLLALGRPSDAHTVAVDALDLAERTGELGAKAYSQAALAACLRAMGRDEDGASLLEAAAALASDLQMAPLLERIRGGDGRRLG